MLGGRVKRVEGRVKRVEKGERSKKGKAKNEEQVVPSSHGPFGTSESMNH
jgi:hypothetical protein